MRRAAGARTPSRARHSDSWSPRLLPASACTSSSTIADRVANGAAASGMESSTARLSGVVSRMLGGAARWRRRVSAEVSPVRVSMVMGNDSSETGRIRLRAMSLASAFSGLT